MTFIDWWGNLPPDMKKGDKALAERRFNAIRKAGQWDRFQAALSNYIADQGINSWRGWTYGTTFTKTAVWQQWEPLKITEMHAMPDRPIANNRASRPASNGSGLTREAQRARSGDFVQNRESYELPLFASNESVPEKTLRRCDFCGRHPVETREIPCEGSVAHMCLDDYAEWSAWKAKEAVKA